MHIMERHATWMLTVVEHTDVWRCVESKDTISNNNNEGRDKDKQRIL